MNSNPVSEMVRQFFGGCFHQDWDLVAEEWQGVVDDYSAGKDAARLSALAREIDDFRKSHDEETLAELMLRHAHSAYNPRPLATYHEWLGQITNRLRQHAAGTTVREPPGE